MLNCDALLYTNLQKIIQIKKFILMPIELKNVKAVLEFNFYLKNVKAMLEFDVTKTAFFDFFYRKNSNKN